MREKLLEFLKVAQEDQFFKTPKDLTELITIAGLNKLSEQKQRIFEYLSYSQKFNQTERLKKIIEEITPLLLTKDPEPSPEIEMVDEVFKVSIPIEDGKILFSFSDIEQTKSREIECMLDTSFLIPGYAPKPFSGRINICSLSARESYSRQLSKSFQQKLTWELFLSRACTLAINYIANKDTSFWIDETNLGDENPFSLEPFIVDSSPNVLFGQGGSGKTFFSLVLALSFSTGLSFLDFKPIKQGKVLFIDYEADARTIWHRINLLCGSDNFKPDLEQVRQSIRYFPSLGVPLADLVPSLLKIIKQNDIKLVIIDSAALACGNEPERAESAIRYFNALKKLNITSLTIAHETKSENKKYPFGSIFWSNCSRNNWNIQRSEEDDINEETGEQNSLIRLGLFHRKSNNDRLRPPIAIKLSFNPSFVDFTWDSVGWWEGELSVPRRIYRQLKSGGLTMKELRDEFPDIESNTIRTALKRLKYRSTNRIELIGERWQIVSG